MAEFAKFRTAIGGFHRGDVVNYIESASKAHQAEVWKLRRELDELRKEKELLEQKLAEQSGDAPQPEAPAVPAIQSTEQELEAYRRAEATERMATERAEKLREQMSALCDKATGEYAGCFEKVQHAQTEVENTFAELREAMQELETTIQQTKDSFERASISK